MKTIAYRLLYAILLLFLGCTAEEFQQEIITAKDEGAVRLRFQTVIPEFRTLQTRAAGGVNEMKVLVFDQNGTFITIETASLSNQTETGGSFIVSLPSSSEPRILHFICNHNWDSFNPSGMLGSNEAAVVALMRTDHATFWARRELSGGINANALPASNPVVLLRNQAKISVTNEAANFNLTGFVIHKRPDIGSIAPFNTTTAQFEEHAITEPQGMTLLDAQQSEIGTGEQYLFERSNRAAQQITTAIVSGEYNGTATFYKIDLVDANKVRYNIERNYLYMVKIMSVTKEGYSSFTDALNGASHNNAVLDPIIEKYPMISDGTAKLEVEKTLVIVTEPGKAISLWAHYYPDLNSSSIDDSGVSVTLISNEGALAVGSLSWNPATGTITATSAASLPIEQGEALILVQKGDLARTIRVVLRTPFQFDPVTINDLNPAQLVNDQDISATLKFNIPADFPADLFPLPVNIYTQGLYPAASGLQMVVEQGVIHYVYQATTTGEQTVLFKTNKSGNNETVTLQADYFTDGTVAYYPDFLIISGSIKYNERYQSWFGWWNRWSDVPQNATVSVSVSDESEATMVIPSSGDFLFRIPFTTGNPTITFTYESDGETYRQAISLNDLQSNPSLRLNWIE